MQVLEDNLKLKTRLLDIFCHALISITTVFPTYFALVTCNDMASPASKLDEVVVYVFALIDVFLIVFWVRCDAVLVDCCVAIAPVMYVLPRTMEGTLRNFLRIFVCNIIMNCPHYKASDCCVV